MKGLLQVINTKRPFKKTKREDLRMNKNLKKLISTVAALAITVTSAVSAFAAFPDVADTADYKVAVDNIAALGIVSGDENGNFNPEKEITRAEVSKMIVGTMGPKRMAAAEASMGVSTFDDVPAGHWATGYIAQGVSAGFINGVGGNNFDPSSNVTFAQVVKMLVCVLGYDEDAKLSGGWPNGYIAEGGRLGVTDGVNVAGDVAVNRGQVAMLINNALDIPIKGIEGYENGIAVDENGNIYTTQIPVTEVYDGEGDSEKYETLLTFYFDAYSVRGRITDTAEKNKGVVSYTVEFAENFDGEVNYYTGKKDAPTEEIEAYYPKSVDVDSLLAAYTDAIIMENEDGDWEIISIASYGKNEVVELSAELYVEDTFAKDTMEFYKSETSSKTDDYDLDDEVVVYVNGSKVKAADAVDAVEEYLEYPTTEVKLVNTPKVGSRTIDSAYDYVMLTVYGTAVVDDVMVKDDEVTIYLEDYSVIETSKIVLDFAAVEDGEAEYTIVDVDGNEVAAEELQYNDILTIYADVYADAKLTDLTFVDITVARDTVTGKVMSEDQENNKYEIADTMYGFAMGADKLEVGNDYTIYLDKFGKIAKYEVSAADVNYGIINRVWETSNGEPSVRLVNADGEIVTYEFKNTDDYNDWKALYDEYVEDDVKFTDVVDKDADENDIYAYQTLIVTYKVNSSDKIYSIEDVTAENFKEITAEYNERNTKVSSAKMSDLTKVVDYAKAKDVWSGSVSGKVGTGSVASFVDGETYTVIYGGEKFTDGTFPFVVVLEGQADISTASRFAVVKSTGKAVNAADGIEYSSAVVLEGDEEITLYFEDDSVAEEVSKGSVMVYSLNGEGLVEKAVELYNAEDSIKLADVAAYASKYATKGAAYDSALYLDYDKMGYGSELDSWMDLDKDEKYARVGYGVLVDKTSSDITVGKVVAGTTSYYEEIELASDVNVYVYDQGVKLDKLEAGAIGSLTATKIAKQYYQTDDENVYQWAEAGEEAVNTVFFKTFEDEITDIIVIIPKPAN